MKFSFHHLLLSTLFSFSFAHPKAKRICGNVLLPTTLTSLHQNDPNTAYPNARYTSSSVYLYQDVNEPSGAVADKLNALIAFNGPPAGAYGCTPDITFPNPYTFKVFTGNPSQRISVYTVPIPLPAAPTYSNIIPDAYVFGTVVPQAGMSAVINSRVCPMSEEGGLAFVFSYADDFVELASIAWDEYVNEMNGAGLRGVYLSSNC